MKRVLVIAAVLSALAAHGKPKPTALAKCEGRCEQDLTTCVTLTKKAAKTASIAAMCARECAKLEKKCQTRCTEPREKRKKHGKKNQ